MFSDPAQRKSLLRYCLIGFAAFLIDYSLLQLFLKFGLPIVIANSLSTAIAIVFSFLSHRHFSFRHAKEAGYHFKVSTQAVLFVVINLLSIVFNTGIVVLLVHWSLTAGQAKIVASAVLLIWNYFTNRFVTFRTAPSQV